MHIRELISVLNYLINIIFPRRCVGCGKNNELYCGNCLESTPRASENVNSFITSVFDYRNSKIRRAIWLFKYKNMRGYAKIFAPLLYDEIIGALGDELFIPHGGNILISGIPLHRKRLHERGYNQSDLLVREILKLDSANIFSYVPNIITRTRETKPQAKSEKRNDRLKNMRNAFTSLNTAEARGRTIILIDDVTTTGATLIDAKRALSHLRPRKVLAFAVAH